MNERVPDGDHIKIKEEDGVCKLIIDGVKESDSGKYELIAINDQGSKSAEDNLKVKPDLTGVFF